MTANPPEAEPRSEPSDAVADPDALEARAVELATKLLRFETTRSRTSRPGEWWNEANPYEDPTMPLNAIPIIAIVGGAVDRLTGRRPIDQSPFDDEPCRAAWLYGFTEAERQLEGLADQTETAFCEGVAAACKKPVDTNNPYPASCKPVHDAWDRGHAKGLRLPETRT